MPNYFKNYRYTGDPNVDYNYNAYGSNNTSDDLLTGNNGFYNRHWKWALAQATEMFRPIAEALGTRNIHFSEENDFFTQKPLSETSRICGEILGKPSKTFYGCTTQGDYNLNNHEEYIKPQSTTYLAQEWALGYVANAMHHELSHQSIISVRQMLTKDHNDRIKKGLPHLTKESIEKVNGILKRIDDLLDSQDVATFDASTGKIRIDSKSDVYPLLKACVDGYIRAFQR